MSLSNDRAFASDARDAWGTDGGASAWEIAFGAGAGEGPIDAYASLAALIRGPADPREEGWAAPAAVPSAEHVALAAVIYGGTPGARGDVGDGWGRASPSSAEMLASALSAEPLGQVGAFALLAA